MPTDVPKPMTREERFEAMELLIDLPGDKGVRGRELGAKLVQDGELDPNTRAVLLGMESMAKSINTMEDHVVKELRASRWWSLLIPTLAMLLVGGLFGVAGSVALPGGMGVEVGTTAVEMREAPAEDDDDTTMDDAAYLEEDTYGPWPQE